MCHGCGKVGCMKPKVSMSLDAVYYEVNGEQEAWDDVSGAELDPKLVRVARSEEMEQFKKHEVYVKVIENECWQATGKAPIGTRWIDIKETKRYRSTDPG